MSLDAVCVNEFVGLMKLRIEAGIFTDALNMAALFYGILVRSGVSPHAVVFGNTPLDLVVLEDGTASWAAQFRYDVAEPASESERTRSAELFGDLRKFAFSKQCANGGLVACITNCRETVFTAKTYQTEPMVLNSCGAAAQVNTIWNLKLANGTRLLIFRVAKVIPRIC